MGVRRRAAALAITALAAAGCGLASVETADPAAIPTGEPVAHGATATGPIAVLAADRTSGVGWRLLMYESAEGHCLQFEVTQVAEAGCGDLLPDEGRAFGSVSSGGASDVGPNPVHGIVAADIAAVWLVDEGDGIRVQARLVPLDEAGLEGNAFVGFAPQGGTITHVEAVRAGGEVAETYELP
jgi:hypothetical protein